MVPGDLLGLQSGKPGPGMGLEGTDIEGFGAEELEPTPPGRRQLKPQAKLWFWFLGIPI